MGVEKNEAVLLPEDTEMGPCCASADAPSTRERQPSHKVFTIPLNPLPPLQQLNLSLIWNVTFKKMTTLNK